MNKMIEIGRVCFKIAGREAGKPAVIIDIIDKNYVLIDGLVRRKKCNIAHLMPVGVVLKIKKNALTAEVQKLMIDAKIISEVPKKGEKTVRKEKPVKQHMMREKEAKAEAKKVDNKPAAKKAEAKSEPKKEQKKPVAKKAAKKPAAKKDKKPAKKAKK